MKQLLPNQFRRASLCAAALLILNSNVGSAAGVNVLVNGSFEAFNILNAPYSTSGGANGFTNSFAGGNIKQYRETVAGIGWQSSAASPNNLVEIWNGSAVPATGNVPAAEGLQFGELNATLVANLFQDVVITDVGQVGLSLQHRGRVGVDTMTVTITYAGPDGLFNGTGDVVYPVGSFSTGSAAWQEYNVSDILTSVAGGNYRFLFASTSSAGIVSEGNFLDAVAFGVGVPEPASALLGSLGLLLLLRRRRA